MQSTFILWVMLLLAALPLSAQTSAPTGYCGTVALHPDQEEWLSTFQADPDRYNTGARAVLYVPLKVHIVGNDNGQGYFPLADVMRNICQLNDWYRAADIHFYVSGAVNYINSTYFYNHTFVGGRDMMQQHNVRNHLNVYFVNDPAGQCGYYSPFQDAVALRNSCSADGNTTMAHEFGHYLSLPHTFRGWESGTPPVNQQERVDRSNCNSAGDGFCDTPADYLADRWNCPYAGTLLIDPAGDTVVPDGTNIMSYSNDECQTQFSLQQRNAMRGYLLTQKGTMINLGTPATLPASGPATLIEPIQSASNVPSNSVRLTWSKAPNANLYQVQVSRLSIFALNEADLLVSDTSVVLDLQDNRLYYWRVIAFNNGNTCTQRISASGSFTTGYPLGLEAAQALQQVVVAPNPVAVGQSVFIDLTAHTELDGTLIVTDMSGRVIYTMDATAMAGTQHYIPTAGWAQGMYLLHLQTEQGRVTQKVLVH